MKVKSNLLADYEIDGVVFSVTAKITECDDKLKNNFFFKALVENGSFEIVEESKKDKSSNSETKELRANLINEAKELGLEFNNSIPTGKLQELIDSKKAELEDKAE